MAEQAAWIAMAAAGALSWALVVLLGPRTIAWLVGLGHRQRIREDAPSRHRTKAGTPTMGGLLIIPAIAIASLAAGGLRADLLLAVAAVVSFGLVGLVDDLVAIRRDRNLGFRARERLALQLALGLAFGWLASVRSPSATVLALPLMGSVDLGVGYVLFAGLLIVGFANAVNLADGLDGLASGLVAVAALGAAALAVASAMPQVAALSAATAGACLGFLRYNSHPAKVFMGDVGSNALGAALASVAVLLGAELAMLLIGGVFVAEAASVIVQVAYFKMTGGRRIFRMTPLHHHFELIGWPEPVVVGRFHIAGAACLLLGLAAALL